MRQEHHGRPEALQLDAEIIIGPPSLLIGAVVFTVTTDGLAVHSRLQSLRHEVKPGRHALLSGWEATKHERRKEGKT